MIDSFEQFSINEDKKLAEQKLVLAKKTFPKQYAAMEKEKGAEWMVKNLWGAEDNDNGIKTMSDLIYSHFSETKEGEKAWKGGQSEAKVDRIIDAIDAKYVDSEEPISFTDKEWQREVDKISLSSCIYESVYAGVF